MSLRMDPPIGRQAHMRETRAYPLMAVRAGPLRGGTGELPGQDVKPVIPPYEGRKTQADRIGDASESAESGVKIRRRLGTCRKSRSQIAGARIDAPGVPLNRRRMNSLRPRRRKPIRILT